MFKGAEPPGEKHNNTLLQFFTFKKTNRILIVLNNFVVRCFLYWFFFLLSCMGYSDKKSWAYFIFVFSILKITAVSTDSVYVFLKGDHEEYKQRNTYFHIKQILTILKKQNIDVISMHTKIYNLTKINRNSRSCVKFSQLFLKIPNRLRKWSTLYLALFKLTVTFRSLVII